MRDFHATPELCPSSAASASVARSRLLAAGKPPGVAIMARPVVAAPPVKRAASAADKASAPDRSGAASGAQGCSAPPSAPPSPESDDAELIARFKTWIEHQKLVLAFPGDEELEEEFNALDNENTDLMRHVAETPAHTLTGLAIKAFLSLYMNHGGGKTPVSLDDFDFRDEFLTTEREFAARLRDDVLRILSDAGFA
jgi:hypothetical protein